MKQQKNIYSLTKFHKNDFKTEKNWHKLQTYSVADQNYHKSIKLS